MKIGKLLKFYLFTLIIQNGVAQTILINKPYQFYTNFKTIEDSIVKLINPENTLVYKTCEESRAFYFINKNSHWTCYFIKNIFNAEIYPPSIIDDSGKEHKPFITQLFVFNADSLYSVLGKNGIYKFNQISEDSIQARLTIYNKKKNIATIQSLPIRSHDCDATIIVYEQTKRSATYRSVLIDTKTLHFISDLKLFYTAEKILIDVVKNYYD